MRITEKKELSSLMSNTSDLSIFTRQNYESDLFSSFILPWNCNDLTARKQCYHYTHRYNAVLGFDFSYVMRGAERPEFQDASYAGVGFFNSFGETSWLVLDTSDGRIDITGACAKVLPSSLSDNGCKYFYYSGIFFNAYNSIDDQINNKAPHYAHNIFKSLVCSDRATVAYEEQTYWQHITPGMWDSLGWCVDADFAPVLGIKPCKRADVFLDFFGKPRNWMVELDYLGLRNFDWTDKSLSNTLMDRHYFFKFHVNWRHLVWRMLQKRVWKIKNELKRQNYQGLKRRIYRAHIDGIYKIMAHVKDYSSYLASLYMKKKINRKLSISTYKAVKVFSKKLLKISIRRVWRRRRFITKRLRSSHRMRKKIKAMSNFFHQPKDNAHLIYDLAYRRGNMFMSLIYKKKMRKNGRFWYLQGCSPYRNKRAARKAIRYAKIYKSRPFIIVF